MKILLVIVMFFLLVGFFIISENKMALKDEENREEFKNLYFSWLNRTFENFKTITSYVVKLDWLPDSE